MKFLITSNTYPPYHIGGDGVHVKYLAEELAARNHEVHVLHSMDFYNFKRRNSILTEHPQRRNLFIHTFSSPLGKLDLGLGEIFGDTIFAVKEYENLIKELKPDVVHHHNIYHLGHKLFKRYDSYVSLYTAHDYDLICPIQRLYKKSGQDCTRKGCYKCSFELKRPPQVWRYIKKVNCLGLDCIISPSEYLKKVLANENIHKNIVCIPNFVPRLSSRSVHSPVNSNYFLYAGVLEEYKGILRLIEAYKNNTNISAKLLIAGQGSLHDPIRRFISRNNLQEKIILLGWVEDKLLHQLLKKANALVMPSIWRENCPLIALEAFSLGTPVIGSSDGGLPEIVRKVSNDLVFHTIEDLNNILKNFEKSKYSDKVIKIYNENYSTTKFFDTYFKTIKLSVEI